MGFSYICRMKKGFVLEGGAMRGLFSAGVLDEIVRNGIIPDGITGVSAGAAFGCNIKSGQIGRAIRYNKRFARDSRYCSIRSLITSGNIFNAEFAYHRVPEEFDVFDNEAFSKNPMEYYVVCTDICSGKPVYHLCKENSHKFYEWVRASASMPLVSKAVDIDGQKLLDGGLTDSIPLKFMQSQGYTRNLVILTRPYGYIKASSSLTWPVSIAYRKYPELVKVFATRHMMYNRQLEYVAASEADGDSFVIRPPVALNIDHISHSPEQMQAVYDIGVTTARRVLPELIQWWNKE